jgi:hypothetical protein
VNQCRRLDRVALLDAQNLQPISAEIRFGQRRAEFAGTSVLAGWQEAHQFSQCQSLDFVGESCHRGLGGG